MPIEPHDPKTPIYLFLAFLLGALARASRVLQEGWPGFVRFLAGLLGGGVAATIVGAFLIGSAQEGVRAELVFAISGAAGWVGGDAIERLIGKVLGGSGGRL